MGLFCLFDKMPDRNDRGENEDQAHEKGLRDGERILHEAADVLRAARRSPFEPG